jgi:hypothetical protein
VTSRLAEPRDVEYVDPSTAVAGCLDAESGKYPGDRPCEDNWDRQPHDSAKQCWVNLSGDDDIRNQRERGGNQHRPLARLVGIGDCDFIHGVEVTGPVDDRTSAVATNTSCSGVEGQPLYGPGSSGGHPKTGSED